MTVTVTLIDCSFVSFGLGGRYEFAAGFRLLQLFFLLEFHPTLLSDRKNQSIVDERLKKSRLLGSVFWPSRTMLTSVGAIFRLIRARAIFLVEKIFYSIPSARICFTLTL